MISFTNYKIHKLEEQSRRRHALLEEMEKINTNLIEIAIPKKEEKTTKTSYKFIEKKRLEEIVRLSRISSEMTEEAKKIRAKWEKENYDPFQ